MKNLIIQTFYSLLSAVSTEKHRYLFSQIDLSQRLIGIVGARGTGKTTMMLQIIKEKIKNPDEALYFTADHLYFSNNSMLEFIQEQYEVEGRTFFCIDEVHKYENWNQELKNVYDSFPQVHILFSGSSSLDLIKGSYDLSRRGLLYHLQGLSFREYLLFKQDESLPSYSFYVLMQSHQAISGELSGRTGLLKDFGEYLRCGYYPFYFEDRAHFSQRLLSVIEKTIYEDVSGFYSLKTSSLPVLKKILAFLTTINPGEISVNGLAKALAVDNKTVQGYLDILEKSGLIMKIGVDKSGAAMIRKSEKIFLGNSNLYHSMSLGINKEVRVGTLRECFFLSMMRGIGNEPFYTKVGDYRIEDSYFEIGGKGKDYKQIKDSKNSYLVKDEILMSGGKREIPLYLFGFLY